MNTTDPRYNTNFKLWKDFSFEAAHQLTLVPPGHQCGRLHGHSYKVRVHCQGLLSAKTEWVVDYAEIARVTRPIIAELDHGFLNHILDLETTAENLAWWIGQRIKKKLGNHLYAIEVFETPTTSVSVDI